MPSPRKDKELVEIYLVLEEIIARGCDVMPIIGYDDSHGDYRDGWWSVDEPTKVQRAKREQRFNELLQWVRERIDHKRLPTFTRLNGIDDWIWVSHKRDRPGPKAPLSSYDLIRQYREYCKTMSVKQAKCELLKKLELEATAKALKSLERRIQRAEKDHRIGDDDIPW